MDDKQHIKEQLEQLLEVQKAHAKEEERKERKANRVRLLLFVLTLLSTTFAGSEWIAGKNVIFSDDYNWQHFVKGLWFAIPFLGILTIHEFGHYFMAKYHKVSVTLPNYLPGWLGFLGIPSIGTFGAVIRIKDKINSKKKYFDIGVAGPLAGFVAALLILFYAFANLPDASYIYEIHPEYAQYGENYEEAYQEEGSVSVYLGSNLLFMFFEHFVADPERLPNRYEMIHYPLIFAGYLALFFTALNLLPIGQLDGGHIIYGLFGRKYHRWISTSLFLILAFLSGIGIVSPFENQMDTIFYTFLYVGFLYISFRSLPFSKINKLTLAFLILGLQFLFHWQFPLVEGFQVYLLFVFLLGRVLGVQHPIAKDESPLSTSRKIIGWISLLVFVLCFSPQPFNMEIME